MNTKLSLAAALALATTACGPVQSPWMTRVETAPALAPAADTATIVFVRPSGYMPGLGVILVDPQGKCHGVSTAESRFALPVAPGEHTVLWWSDPPTVMKATVEAGKLYFVEVSPAPGEGVRLFAVTPSSPQWAELPQWLTQTSFQVPDTSKLGECSALDKSKELAMSGSVWSGYGADEVARRTLRAEDGVTSAP
jgi:hypothetical protein